MGARRTPYVDEPHVIDLEAGKINDQGLKDAGFVAESFYDDQEYTRIEADLSDFALDLDTGLTRATRDRDRAFPRDVTEVNERKRRPLPGKGDFRTTLSRWQRRDRSATKNRVQAAAPEAGRQSVAKLITDPDLWLAVNSELRQHTGNAQKLTPSNRKFVQRVDRIIQSYERENDRGHLVYVVAQLPFSEQVTTAGRVPETLLPGARLSFDQFTLAHHTLEEAAAVADHATGDPGKSTIILEIQTGRGLYLGRSDSIPDTAHLLPRGIGLRVQAIDPAALHPSRSDGTGLRESLVIQCTDARREPDYQAPVAGRERIRERRKARLKAQKAKANRSTGGTS